MYLYSTISVLAVLDGTVGNGDIRMAINEHGTTALTITDTVTHHQPVQSLHASPNHQPYGNLFCCESPVSVLSWVAVTRGDSVQREMTSWEMDLSDECTKCEGLSVRSGGTTARQWQRRQGCRRCRRAQGVGWLTVVRASYRCAWLVARRLKPIGPASAVYDSARFASYHDIASSKVDTLLRHTVHPSSHQNGTMVRA